MSISLNGTSGITTPGLDVDTNTLYIDPVNNRVGIGTSNPVDLLDVRGDIKVGQTSSVGAIKFRDNNSWIRHDNSSTDLRIGSNNILTFRTGWDGSSEYIERMRITADGNVGIGTSSPVVPLHVTKDGASLRLQPYTGGGELDFYNGSTFLGTYGVDTSNAFAGSWTNVPFRFYTNSTERVRISTTGGLSVGTTADPGVGAIYATGNVTAYYSSDARLKENIKDIPNALDKVCAIGSKTFDWTDEVIESKGGEDGYFVQKSDFGVIAQDVQAVSPQAVRTRNDGTLAVDYEKLATLAFGAIKELVKRIEALES